MLKAAFNVLGQLGCALMLGQGNFRQKTTDGPYPFAISRASSVQTIQTEALLAIVGMKTAPIKANKGRAGYGNDIGCG